MHIKKIITIKSMELLFWGGGFGGRGVGGWWEGGDLIEYRSHEILNFVVYTCCAILQLTISLPGLMFLV